MKELIYLAIGMAVGTLMVKKSQTIDELKRELARERDRQTQDKE